VEPSALKKQLAEYLSRRSPGILEFFNVYCTLMYKTDCLTLLFTSPSKLYHIVLMHYKGDAISADYVFTLIFLNPLALLLGREEIAGELLCLAKTGRDKDFAQMLTTLSSKLCVFSSHKEM